AQRGEPAGRRADGLADLRCLGARLLPRLPEPPPRLRAGLSRPSGELGLCRAEPREGLAGGSGADRPPRECPSGRGFVSAEPSTVAAREWQGHSSYPPGRVNKLRLAPASKG